MHESLSRALVVEVSGGVSVLLVPAADGQSPRDIL